MSSPTVLTKRRTMPRLQTARAAAARAAAGAQAHGREPRLSSFRPSWARAWPWRPAPPAEATVASSRAALERARSDPRRPPAPRRGARRHLWADLRERQQAPHPSETAQPLVGLAPPVRAPRPRPQPAHRPARARRVPHRGVADGPRSSPFLARPAPGRHQCGPGTRWCACAWCCRARQCPHRRRTRPSRHTW